MGRMLALLAGTAGVGFGSIAVAQRQGHDLAARPIRARAVARHAASPVPVPYAPKPVLKPRHSAATARRPVRQHVAAAPKPHPSASYTSSPPPTPAPAPTPVPAPAPVQAAPPGQASGPALQAPAQAPVPATPAPAPVVSGGS
jgi:translation initiation factor IF-2